MSHAAHAAFGAGTFAIALFNTLRQLFFAVYVTDVVGLEPRLASGLAFAGLAADVLLVPRIAAWTNRHRSRLGRRRPFLLAGAIPAGLAFVVLWAAPPWDSDALRTAHVALAWIAAHALQSLVVVPYLALVPEVAPGYDERTTLTAWRMGMSLAASLAVAVIAPAVLDTAIAGTSAARGHLALALGFGALAAAAWALVGITTREAGAPAAVTRVPAMRALRATLDEPAFRHVAVVYLATWTAFELVALTMPYYLTVHVARGDALATLAVAGADAPLASVVLATLLVSALPALPAITWLSRRLDKRSAFVAGAGVWAVAEVALAALPAGRPYAVVALAALAGVGVATAHVLPDAMVPDAIARGAARTGRRDEAAYAAAQDLLRKLASASALFVVLQALGWSGYTAGGTRGILLLVGPVAVALLAVAAAAAATSPLTRDATVAR